MANRSDSLVTETVDPSVLVDSTIENVGKGYAPEDKLAPRLGKMEGTRLRTERGAGLQLELNWILDVGCGNEKHAKGSVNVDLVREGCNLQIGQQLKGEQVNPHKIPNFVIADACHLPFRNEAFKMGFSSHTIEHVKDPFAMYSELCRVAERKVVVRCPHRRGSGAKRPFHLNYFDEDWFKKAALSKGYRSEGFISAYDCPISSRLPVPSKLKALLPYRVLRHLERRLLVHRAKIPFELETWVHKHSEQKSFDPLRIVTVYNNPQFLSLHQKSSRLFIPNVDRKGLPSFFNSIGLLLSFQPCWIAFCHQDFFLNEDLERVMMGKDKRTVYGVIGARVSDNCFRGRILQTDNTYIGLHLAEPAPVQTVDEMCLILHSSLFAKGLRFDERFRFHFYGADICMQASLKGLDVKALQVNCQHKSRDLSGDIKSSDYLESVRLFKEKWKAFLPVRTTMMVVTA